MGRATAIAFRSKPISSRAQQLKTTPWKPSGSFRFFDLPPELREQILRNIIEDLIPAHRDVLNLFLTSERLFSETAALFYSDVVLDTTRSQGKPDSFLTGTTTRVSPRRHVRTLSVYFYLPEHVHLFYTRYSSALRDMVENGTLQRLELEIHSHFPSADFWGGDGDSDAEELHAVGKRKGKDVMAPRFVTEAPFQSFLRFLKDAKIPQLRLYVDAFDHHIFWCQYHRSHATGACNGEWKGKARKLKVDWKLVMQEFRGARIKSHDIQE